MSNRSTFWTNNMSHQIQFPQGREDNGYGIRVTVWTSEGALVDAGYLDTETGRVALEGATGLAFEVSVAIFAETIRDRRRDAGQPIDGACLYVTDGEQTTAYRKLYRGTLPARVAESYAIPEIVLRVESREELERVAELAKAHGITFND